MSPFHPVPAAIGFAAARHRLVAAALLAVLAPAAPLAAQAPFAAAVVEYQPGLGVLPGYDDPTRALGSPTRFIEDPLFPGAVTPFSTPYLPTQLCGIGDGGWLVVSFETPVADDPENPHGIDLLVFGNSFFIDAAWPNGIVGGLFNDGGLIEVSADGVHFVAVTTVEADGLYPTMGYRDTGPYPIKPGLVPTDFTRPVDPAMGPMLIGMTYEQLVDAYDGSGGGAGVDLAPTGLAEIRFVRIAVPAGSGAVIEIDGLADVAPARDLPSPDLDGDGVVGGADLAILLANWGEGGTGDLDGDGDTDGGDLTMLLAAWK